MRGLELRNRLSMAVAVIILTGCGGLPSGSLVPAGSAASNAPPLLPSVRAGLREPKGVSDRDLLYVSNSNGTVSVYRYWQRTLVSVLTNFSKPEGGCADRAGNVYITDAGTKKVYEYAHGAKKPLKVLDQDPLRPYGCSVSPANGDLAIANGSNDEYQAGNIAVYPHGSGTPKIYKGPYDDHFINCAYDDRGDLFTNSEIVYYYSFFYDIAFYYLPKRGTQLIAEDLSEPYFSSGWPYVHSIAYDGKYWVVDASGELFFYKINIQPEYIGKFDFSGSYYVGTIAFLRKSLAGRATQVVGAAGTRSSSTQVVFWKYPALASPVGTIDKDLDEPTGLTISLGQHT